MENKTTGVIYFRLNKDVHGYEGDITKNCGLTGQEVDSNFHFLRGYDILNGEWDAEHSLLVLKRVNGDSIAISGITGGGGVPVVIASGSTYHPETGTLELNINGEITPITGFSECCKSLVHMLTELAEATEEELTELKENFFTYFEIYGDALNEEVNLRIRGDEDLQEQIDALEVRTSQIECDINSLRAEDTKIRRELQRVKQDLESEIQNETQRRVNSEETIIGDYQNKILEEKNQRISGDTAINSKIQSLSSVTESNTTKITQIKSQITTLKNDVNRKNARLQEDLQRETELRRNADENILQTTDQKISNEKQERIDGDRLITQALQIEISNRAFSEGKLEEKIDREKNALQTNINKEKSDRISADSVIYELVYSLMLNSENEYNQLKNQLESYYTYSGNTNAVKMQNIVDDNGNLKRLVYLALAEDDKILSQGCGYLTSTLNIGFNKNNNRIELYGIDNAVVSSFDASVFIQKGFLKDATVEEVSGETCLVLYWEGVEQPTIIPATALFEPYRNGDGIDINNTGRTISIKIRNGEKYLGVGVDGLYTKGIDEIENTVQVHGEILSAHTESINQIISSITSAITSIEGNTNEINSIKEDISDIENTISGISKNVSQNSTNITTLSGAVDEIKLELKTVGNEIGEINQSISGINSDITSIQTHIQNNEENISGNTTDIVRLREDISGHTEEIQTLQDNVRDNTDSINNLQDTVSGHTQDISKLKQDVLDNTQKINELVDGAQEEGEVVSGLTNRVEANERAISGLVESVKENSDDITSLRNSVETLEDNEWEQILSGGTKIARFKLNGEWNDVYAPKDGSNVIWRQISTGDTQIATIVVDGNPTPVYAPSGSKIIWEQIITEGVKIATININGVETDIYAPEGGGSIDNLVDSDDIHVNTSGDTTYLTIKGIFNEQMEIA